MLPKPVTELVILKLVYVPPNVDIKNAVVLHRPITQILTCRTRRIREWYYNMMAKEYVNVPRGDTVQFCLWRIKTSQAELFTVNNIRYDNLLFFVGHESIHWIYYNLEPIFKSVEGVTPLTLSYCNCCFDTQYLKFIESIHENLETTGYLLS